MDALALTNHAPAARGVATGPPRCQAEAFAKASSVERPSWIHEKSLGALRPRRGHDPTERLAAVSSEANSNFSGRCDRDRGANASAWFRRRRDPTPRHVAARAAALCLQAGFRGFLTCDPREACFREPPPTRVPSAAPALGWPSHVLQQSEKRFSPERRPRSGPKSKPEGRTMPAS